MNPNNELPAKCINCPSCGTEWNNTEIEEQECYTCGHPDCWERESDDENDD